MPHNNKDLWENIKVARPCKVSWEGMSGDDKVRACLKCKKNVYNISAMTHEQAEAVIRENEGELCIRLYRRADGTVVTRDCPLPAYIPWLTVTGASLVTAAIISALLFAAEPLAVQGQRVAPSSHPLPKLVYAARDIAEGREITPDLLEERDVEAINAPIDGFCSVNAVIGQRAIQQIPAGSIISQHSVRSK